MVRRERNKKGILLCQPLIAFFEMLALSQKNRVLLGGLAQSDANCAPH